MINLFLALITNQSSIARQIVRPSYAVYDRSMVSSFNRAIVNIFGSSSEIEIAKWIYLQIFFCRRNSKHKRWVIRRNSTHHSQKRSSTARWKHSDWRRLGVMKSNVTSSYAYIVYALDDHKPLWNIICSARMVFLFLVLRPSTECTDVRM